MAKPANVECREAFDEVRVSVKAQDKWAVSTQAEREGERDGVAVDEDRIACYKINFAAILGDDRIGRGDVGGAENLAAVLAKGVSEAGSKAAVADDNEDCWVCMSGHGGLQAMPCPKRMNFSARLRYDGMLLANQRAGDEATKSCASGIVQSQDRKSNQRKDSGMSVSLLRASLEEACEFLVGEHLVEAKLTEMFGSDVTCGWQRGRVTGACVRGNFLEKFER